MQIAYAEVAYKYSHINRKVFKIFYAQNGWPRRQQTLQRQRQLQTHSLSNVITTTTATASALTACAADDDVIANEEHICIYISTIIDRRSRWTSTVWKVCARSCAYVQCVGELMHPTDKRPTVGQIDSAAEWGSVRLVHWLQQAISEQAARLGAALPQAQ